MNGIQTQCLSDLRPSLILQSPGLVKILHYQGKAITNFVE